MDTTLSIKNSIGSNTINIKPNRAVKESINLDIRSQPKESENNQNSAKETTKELNKISDNLNLDIKFAYNDKIDTLYINITDKNTGEIIRKLPTEEAMKIKESMQDLIGVLFDKKG